MSNKRRRKQSQTSFLERNRVWVIAAAALAAFVVIIFVLPSAHQSPNAVTPNSGETNPIGLQQSDHPTDTDIAGLQAAEQGAFGEPALVWFHADW